MHKIIAELKSEHLTIRSLMKSDDIFKLIQFVESVHHPKEEELLFPLLAQHPLLKQGGPRCMFFQGLILDLKVLDRPRQLLSEYYFIGGPLPEAYKDFPWLSVSNPLDIPMAEHRLGRELAQGLQHLFQNPSSLLYKKFYAAFRTEYYRLLELHMEKEDTCLFILAEKALVVP